MKKKMVPEQRHSEKITALNAVTEAYSSPLMLAVKVK